MSQTNLSLMKYHLFTVFMYFFHFSDRLSRCSMILTSLNTTTFGHRMHWLKATKMNRVNASGMAPAATVTTLTIMHIRAKQCHWQQLIMMHFIPFVPNYSINLVSWIHHQVMCHNSNWNFVTRPWRRTALLLRFEANQRFDCQLWTGPQFSGTMPKLRPQFTNDLLFHDVRSPSQ